MNPALTLALAMSDVASFSQPPNRPPRTERRTRATAAITSLLRAVRREIALAAQNPSSAPMPRITNYPY